MSERIGDSNLVFGTTDESWGYIEATQIDHSPALLEAMNGQNEVVAGEYSKDMKKVTGTYLFRNVSGDPLLIVGDGTTITLTDVGLAIYVNTASKIFAVNGWAKVSFEGVYYPNLGS